MPLNQIDNTSTDAGAIHFFFNDIYPCVKEEILERVHTDVTPALNGFIIPLIEGAGVTLCGCNTCIQIRKKK